MALDAAEHPGDMGRVSRLIAEGQNHLACAEAAVAASRGPSSAVLLFDPRHGMSSGTCTGRRRTSGPGREVPACSACAHKVDQGIEPELRTVDVAGDRVSYLDHGFAPAYWGGYGFLPGMFTGFFLGELLTRSWAGAEATGTRLRP